MTVTDAQIRELRRALLSERDVARAGLTICEIQLRRHAQRQTHHGDAMTDDALSDEKLAELEDIALFRVPDGHRLDGVAAIKIRDNAAKRWFVNLVREIRRHRDAQLTTEDREALRLARRVAAAHCKPGDSSDAARIVSVLDRLLAAENP